MRSLRLTLIILIATLTIAGVFVPAAGAKGGSSIVGAVVSGGKLVAPQQVEVQIPENEDDMFEMTPAPTATEAERLQYAVTLQYDFEEGYGRRDWTGKYDGDDILYFPQSMLVGNGTWAAGWYKAGEPLGRALRQATDVERVQTLPATGSGAAGDKNYRTSSRWQSFALIGIAAALVAAQVAHARIAPKGHDC